jgi:putative DNA primase/helicase
VSRAVALSALITPVVRGALSVAPLHAFRATTAGTGKSYLVDVVSSISSGRPCPVISAAPDDIVETEKRIVSQLLAGHPIISIDNVNGELGGDLLCQAIERPLIRIRPLGTSVDIEIENRASVLATGNQMRVVGDMVRRTVVADLDANVERPELRKFTGNPVATVVANRGYYVSAALMIVRAYIAAGKPGCLPALASFEDWSDLVRSALVWLGCDDPVLSMEQARDADPELSDLREALAVWATTLGCRDGFTASDIAKHAEERAPTILGEPPDYAHPELREVVHRLAGVRGTIDTRRLGKWLLGREGRIVGNQKFIRRGKAHGGVVMWGVQITK